MKQRNLLREAAASLWRLTLTAKLVSTISSLFYYIKSYLYVRDTFYSGQFAYVLKQYLHVQFRKDWIGRLYGVINPNIDINGNIDFSTQIIEFTEDGLSTDSYVQNWVYKQLGLVKSVFSLQKSGFFDYIGASFKHVGPANSDNWLVVFDIVDRKRFVLSLYKLIKHVFLYAVIFCAVFRLCGLIFD